MIAIRARASRLFLCVFAVFVMHHTSFAAAQEAGEQSLFQRTAKYVQYASPELRRDFAVTALSSLAAAYFAEATLAREDARKAGRDADLRGWAFTVDRFASQMPLLLEDMELGLPVNLTIGQDQILAITVADRTVILSPPRLNQQSAFEQRILVEFCARHDCEQFLPAEAEPEPIPVSTVLVRPNWVFSAQGSDCSYEGINVRFNSAQNMTNARLICEQFLQEVIALTAQLAWQQRHAVPIEWDKLRIQATPQRPEHMLRLNTAGDVVLVTVPLLYNSPGLLRQLIPWMRVRLSNQQQMSVALDASDYGWQKP